jgi:AcrR family transcriptional regulator
MPKKAPLETKEKLLHAATQLILHRGASHLTLDGVALEAGISKGGLLHHFPTKQTLLVGLMDQLGEVFKRRLTEFMALEQPGQSGSFARAYIRASFEYADDELQLTNAIAGVVGEFPELLKELQLEFADLEQKMQSDGIPAPKATVIRLACDGLWFSELLGMSGLEEPQRSALLQELLGMTR